jgi:hypothetical protein
MALFRINAHQSALYSSTIRQHKRPFFALLSRRIRSVTDLLDFSYESETTQKSPLFSSDPAQYLLSRSRSRRMSDESKGRSWVQRRRIEITFANSVRSHKSLWTCNSPCTGANRGERPKDRNRYLVQLAASSPAPSPRSSGRFLPECGRRQFGSRSRRDCPACSDTASHDRRVSTAGRARATDPSSPSFRAATSLNAQEKKVKSIIALRF